MLTIFATALIMAASGGLASCSSEKKPSTTAPETISMASVIVHPTALPDVVEATGTVRAADTAALAAQIMGNLLAVNVREGDHVRQGQVLALIDDAQLRAGLERAQAAVSAADHELAAAEAEYALASSTLKRYQELLEKKAASPQEFDEVNTRCQAASARRDMARSGQAQAKAGLAQATTLFSYTRIRAPFDGVVTEKRVDPGALAAPGMPLLTVEKSGRFRLEAMLDESNLRSVKPGEPVTVQLDAVNGQRFSGNVIEIVPAADPGSRTFLVKIELPPNPGLRSGLFGRAYFTRGQRESLVVARTAVVDRGQLQGVFVVGPERIAELRYITLGKPQGDGVEVLSGLQPGDQVVLTPGSQDLGGKRVQ
jgi:RND family efflux transporter MFP subunit